MEGVLHALVEHGDRRKDARVQASLHLFQGLGEERALHQAMNTTEVHRCDLHRTTEREKRDRQEMRGDGEQQGQHGSVSHTG